MPQYNAAQAIVKHTSLQYPYPLYCTCTYLSEKNHTYTLQDGA